MGEHRIYRAIVAAVKSGELVEPFGEQEFRKSCPGFGEGTYPTFLGKHRRGNGETSELFDRVSRGKYVLMRPLKYGE
jgi:hypothetical protein